MYATFSYSIFGAKSKPRDHTPNDFAFINLLLIQIFF